VDRSKSYCSITVAMAVEFIKEIMYKFGVPNNIITNNRTQFTAREFKDFGADLALKLTMPQCHTRRATVKWSAQTT
jgi:hypothetical protein